MVEYTCKNCGGQMKLSEAGGFVCPYCNSHFFMADKDFQNNQQFRNKLLSYQKAQNDEKTMSYATDTLWEKRGRDTYLTPQGQKVNIDFMDKFLYNGCILYVAKETVIYVFEKSTEADQFLVGLHKLTFPEADSKLYRCFPELKKTMDLSEGKALIFVRRPHFYPLQCFIPLEVSHAAWVVSRMENICCALEFSDLQHGGITPQSLFINVNTHEGALYGDWRGVHKRTGREDLLSIRQVAKAITVGEGGPALYREFLNSMPKETAFDDFSYWDTVVEKGFGGHNFRKYQK